MIVIVWMCTTSCNLKFVKNNMVIMVIYVYHSMLQNIVVRFPVSLLKVKQPFEASVPESVDQYDNYVDSVTISFFTNNNNETSRLVYKCDDNDNDLEKDSSL